MLSATAWVFIIAAYNPGWFRQSAQKRAFYAAAEGIVFALVWSGISIVVQQVFAVQDLLAPALAGVAWAATSFYGKTRFKASVEAVDRQRLHQVFRR